MAAGMISDSSSGQGLSLEAEDVHPGGDIKIEIGSLYLFYKMTYKKVSESACKQPNSV